MSEDTTDEQQTLMESLRCIDKYLKIELAAAGREVMLWRIVALAEAALCIIAAVLLIRS